jgi:hypothetical protein
MITTKPHDIIRKKIVCLQTTQSGLAKINNFLNNELQQKQSTIFFTKITNNYKKKFIFLQTMQKL